MADDTLSTLLQDPQKLQQIMQLASNVMEKTGNTPSEPPPSPEPPPTPFSPPGGLNTGGGSSPLLQSLLRGTGAPGDANRIQLLNALKPFISDSAGDQLEHAARLLRTARMVRSAATQFLPHDETEV